MEATTKIQTVMIVAPLDYRGSQTPERDRALAATMIRTYAQQMHDGGIAIVGTHPAWLSGERSETLPPAVRGPDGKAQRRKATTETQRGFDVHMAMHLLPAVDSITVVAPNGYLDNSAATIIAAAHIQGIQIVVPGDNSTSEPVSRVIDDLTGYSVDERRPQQPSLRDLLAAVGGTSH